MSTEPASVDRPSPLGRVAAWVRRLGVPVRDPRFWVIQALVLGIDVGHTLLEDAHLLVGDSELYLLSVSVFLIPVVYAALSFGTRGAVPTALWALVLSLPEISHHDWTTRIGILTQFTIVLAIAAIVALRVDRENAAKGALQEANRHLSRLNRTASAVAGSVDLDHVLGGTLVAMLDSDQMEIVWIRLTDDASFSERTDIAASCSPSPARLDETQERLTAAACSTGRIQSDDPTGTTSHTVVAPLKSENRVLGAIGLTRPDQGVSADEFPVHSAIANELSVALNNVSSHQRNLQALVSLREAKKDLETYIALATDAQEEERKRLSRELHDDILQSLVVAKAQIESAGATEQADLALSRLTSAQEVLGDAIVNVRRYCHDLRPSLLDDLGLVDALDWLVSDLRARTDLTARLEFSGSPNRRSARDELLVFRIVQEALHNVENHAHASEVLVSIVYTDESLEVSVVDNGRGITGVNGGGPGQPERGLGLRGMDERAKLLRGSLTIRSQAGEGTQVRLMVPIGTAETTQIMLGMHAANERGAASGI